ncbi:MAG TPA: HEAT repeat domain-containing protein [Candidatus Saccharimonadia bacterium]|nr:HEAT repeat domain-containing protein [Candidatus Saccharimonadia bacterium]
MPDFDPQDLTSYLSDVGGSDDDRHYHALEVLVKHAEKTRDPLITLLHSAPEEFTRSRCATVLSCMQHPAVQEALLSALQEDDSWVVRSNAVTGLRDLEDTSAVPAIIKALSDSSEIVRRWCAGILGKLGDERAVPRLKQALQNKDEWTTFHAASSLRQWHIPEARTKLEHLRDHALDSSIRTCAKQALWEWDNGKVK